MDIDVRSFGLGANAFILYVILSLLVLLSFDDALSVRWSHISEECLLNHNI